jgi:hypothetical protein
LKENEMMGGHVGRMGENRNSYRIFIEKPEEGDHFECLGVNKKIILKGHLKKGTAVAWTGFL